MTQSTVGKTDTASINVDLEGEREVIEQSLCICQHARFHVAHLSDGKENINASGATISLENERESVEQSLRIALIYPSHVFVAPFRSEINLISRMTRNCYPRLCYYDS